MASLSSLPNELLLRIAGNLTLSAAFNFVRVNHHLYAVCYDRLVFKEIAQTIRSSNGTKGPKVDVESSTWTEGRALLDGASLDQTIRVASAVEQANSLVTMNARPRWELNEWLPQLLAAHHPICYRIKHRVLLDHYTLFLKFAMVPGGGPASNDASVINISYSLASLLLESVGKGPEENDFVDEYLGFWRQYDRPSALYDLFRVCVLTENPMRHLYTRSAHALVIAMTLIMVGARNRKLPLPSRFEDEHRINLPRPSRIPFHTFMNLPPLKNATFEPFSRCHVDVMTTPDFLTGDWEGFYTDHRSQGLVLPKIDPPMRSISLVARAPNPDIDPKGTSDRKTMIDLSSRGRDSIGQFGLIGEVFDDGRIALKKHYLHRHETWFWKGWMTPFGIVAAWGSANLTFGGYVWIWKKEWSDVPPTPTKQKTVL
jgi:hypothetical protein